MAVAADPHTLPSDAPPSAFRINQRIAGSPPPSVPPASATVTFPNSGPEKAPTPLLLPSPASSTSSLPALQAPATAPALRPPPPDDCVEPEWFGSFFNWISALEQDTAADRTSASSGAGPSSILTLATAAAQDVARRRLPQDGLAVHSARDRPPPGPASQQRGGLQLLSRPCDGTIWASGTGTSAAAVAAATCAPARAVPPNPEYESWLKSLEGLSPPPPSSAGVGVTKFGAAPARGAVPWPGLPARSNSAPTEGGVGLQTCALLRPSRQGDAVGRSLERLWSDAGLPVQAQPHHPYHQQQKARMGERRASLGPFALSNDPSWPTATEARHLGGGGGGADIVNAGAQAAAVLRAMVDGATTAAAMSWTAGCGGADAASGFGSGAGRELAWPAKQCGGGGSGLVAGLLPDGTLVTVPSSGLVSVGDSYVVLVDSDSCKVNGSVNGCGGGVHGMEAEVAAAVTAAGVATTAAGATVVPVRPIRTRDPLKPGDWICPNSACHFHNFARRVACAACGTSDSRAGRI
ncbi:hypothetical protein HK405_003439 [Cladochytrium tenue]|nr:hypothetical protein HK405_003439 [Cladochytrium tenue]